MVTRDALEKYLHICNYSKECGLTGNTLSAAITRNLSDVHFLMFLILIDTCQVISMKNKTIRIKKNILQCDFTILATGVAKLTTEACLGGVSHPIPSLSVGSFLEKL